MALSSKELVEAAEFLVAFGDELADQGEYAQAVQDVLSRAEDKLKAIAFIIGRMGRERAALQDRSNASFNRSNAMRQRRDWLAGWARELDRAASDLSGGDPASNLWYQAHVSSVTVTPPGTKDEEIRRWALQMLASTADMGPMKRTATIVGAIEQHCDPYLAARCIVQGAKMRAESIDHDVRQLATAKEADEGIGATVKGWIQRRLEDDGQDKVVDSQGGWVRTVTRTVIGAVAADWDGKGKPPGPDPEQLPAKYVKREVSVRKRDLTKAMKDGERVPGARLHERKSTYVRVSK